MVKFARRKSQPVEENGPCRKYAILLTLVGIAAFCGNQLLIEESIPSSSEASAGPSDGPHVVRQRLHRHHLALPYLTPAEVAKAEEAEAEAAQPERAEEGRRNLRFAFFGDPKTVELKDAAAASDGDVAYRNNGDGGSFHALTAPSSHRPPPNPDGRYQKELDGVEPNAVLRGGGGRHDHRTVESVDHNTGTHTVSVLSSATGAVETYRYLTPGDASEMSRWRALTKTGVAYMRSQEEIASRSDAILRGGDGSSGACAPSIDVLAWLTDEVNSRDGTLMLTYGGLIHLHREREFVDVETGSFLDDDFDLWSSLETMEMIGSLEHVFYEKFGWSMRFVNNGKYVMLLQAFQVCGHIAATDGGKAQGTRDARRHSGQVGLEIYPLPTLPMVPGDGGMRMVSESIDDKRKNTKRKRADKEKAKKAKCLWMGRQFPMSMIYPVKSVEFKSVASAQTLHLQIPNDSLGLLRCVYGTWEVPSKEHAGVGRYKKDRGDCTDFYYREGSNNATHTLANA